ncbi:NAD-dependent dehydrogenase [Phycomyces nitens]|nr:NAD-dependent dehydrogenase [Phycomyces nitens]
MTDLSKYPQDFLAVKDGEMKSMERKEIRVDENLSFLLTRLDNRYYATSNTCTHYGAKLSESPMTSEGRVICKWHGACFDLKTGDIEDAPALDRLRTFDVTVRNGGVYVKISREELENPRVLPKCVKYNPESKQTVVILGGGASGSSAAQELREQGFDGRIRVVSRENYYPIDRIKVTKQLGIDHASSIQLRSKEFWNNLDVEFLLNTDVVSVDPRQKSVTLKDQVLSFDHLILATGGWPRKFGWEGENLENIFTIRTVNDNQDVSNAIDEFTRATQRKPNLVVVGSSFIGMELVAAANEKANTTIVGQDKVPLANVLGQVIGDAMRKRHESKGVKFILDAKVTGFKPQDSNGSAVGSISIEGRDNVPADIVILAVGVSPQTSYLEKSGLPLARDKSLLVDKYFKVKGTDSIYATGDIATFTNRLTGEEMRIEHWAHAENTGRTVAANIVKNKSVEFNYIPFFWTVLFGATLRYCGYAKSFDRVIVQGETKDIEKLSFVGYYTKDNKVLAICSYMKDPIVSHCAELLRLGKMPTAEEIDCGVNPLDIQLIETYDPKL